MYSETHDRAVWRSRWWALVASMLVAGGVGTGAAWGDIQVHVMNCAQGTVKVAA
jgi:Na+/glutamate symporter